jgi:hypothetical protein
MIKRTTPAQKKATAITKNEVNTYNDILDTFTTDTIIDDVPENYDDVLDKEISEVTITIDAEINETPNNKKVKNMSDKDKEKAKKAKAAAKTKKEKEKKAAKAKKEKAKEQEKKKAKKEKDKKKAKDKKEKAKKAKAKKKKKSKKK